MMLLFCAKNIEIRKIVKLDLYIRIVRCILFFTLPFMGLMINEINIWIGGRTRTFFGWTHPNMIIRRSEERRVGKRKEKMV